MIKTSNIFNSSHIFNVKNKIFNYKMIQYPKNTHVTLPSVEGGFGSMNILKDPPKSIYVQYKEKISDTNRLLDWIDGSGDRICEGILPYARGINQMVSVDYSNSGTNGGRVNLSGASGTDQQPLMTGQAFLPYRVVRDGAFRPPILPPQDLLPLSRQPRNVTHARSNISNMLTQSGLSQDAFSCPDKFKEIRKELLDVCVSPKMSYYPKSNTLTTQIKDAINQKMYLSVNPNLQSIKYSLNVNRLNNKEIKDNVMYAQVTVNPCKDIQAKTIDQPYTIPVKDTLKGCVYSNPTDIEKKIDITNIIDLKLNNPHYSAQANVMGLQKVNRDHVKLSLNQKTMGENVMAHATTNIGDLNLNRNVQLNKDYYSVPVQTNVVDIRMYNDINAKKYNKLAPRMQLGGFENQGTMASNERISYAPLKKRK